MKYGRAHPDATVAEIARRLADESAAARDELHRAALEFDGWIAEVMSSSVAVADALRSYYRLFATGQPASDATIHAYEVGEVDWHLDYDDWARAPGKTGKKEQVCDLPDGWVVRKVRTGMRFALGGGHRIAAGPCAANLNQLVNFVNAAFMSSRLGDGWLLCHAAAVARDHRGVAIAGVSGAGKSTLALHAMNRGLSFVSNDRLLIRPTASSATTAPALEMTGVPKHPRINPGTALANPSLRPLVADARRAELEALDARDLWHLEDKYDADVGQLFDGRWTERAPLSALVILNWSLDASTPVQARRVSFADRPDLWPTVVKHPGPLHVDANGRRPANTVEVAPEPYLEVLSAIPVVEVTGAVDFDAATDVCLELLA